MQPEDLRRKLLDTAILARREADQTTGRLVHETFFPKQATYNNAQIQLHGFNRLSQHSSGQWWFYFQKGSELFVFVAHNKTVGISAALLISAHRAAATLFSKSTYSLKEMARTWDQVVTNCSNGKVKVSAILLRVHVECGDLEYIYASHGPLIIKQFGQKERIQYLPGMDSPALGEGKDVWLCNHSQLEPKDRILILSDSVLTLQNRKGVCHDDKTFLPWITDRIKAKDSPESSVRDLDAQIQKFSEGQVQPDLTYVALAFKAR